MPKPGVTWQWQLTGTVDTSFDVAMYDIDMFRSSKALIEKLHSDGRVVICYFSAGSYEPDRPDSTALANTGLGSVLDGWPDERWIDIRSAAVRDLMKRRLDFAVSQGCDGVEPDNVDGFDNANGLGLTAQDQVDFNLFLAREAHSRGLSIGLKNTLALVPNLVGSFDWALNEECLQFGECASLQPFITAGKAVFHCEYADSEADPDADLDTDTDTDTDTQSEPDDAEASDPDTDSEEDEEDSESDAEYAYIYAAPDATQICATRPAGFSTIVKNLDLDAFRLACN